jgi:hypothetical protein
VVMYAGRPRAAMPSPIRLTEGPPRPNDTVCTLMTIDPGTADG